MTEFALLCRGGGDPGVFRKEGISALLQVSGVGSKAGSLQDCLLGQRVKEVPGGHWRIGACCPGWDVEAGARHCPQLSLAPSPGCGRKAEPSIKQIASLCLSVPTPVLTESGFHHPLITEASPSLCLSVHTH